MAAKKSFLLRVPEDLLDELQKWAQDDLRSMNGQIEFLLREAIRQRKRRQLSSEDSESPEQEQS